MTRRRKESRFLVCTVMRARSGTERAAVAHEHELLSVFLYRYRKRVRSMHSSRDQYRTLDPACLEGLNTSAPIVVRPLLIGVVDGEPEVIIPGLASTTYLIGTIECDDSSV